MEHPLEAPVEPTRQDFLRDAAQWSGALETAKEMLDLAREVRSMSAVAGFQPTIAAVGVMQDATEAFMEYAAFELQYALGNAEALGGDTRGTNTNTESGRMDRRENRDA